MNQSKCISIVNNNVKEMFDAPTECNICNNKLDFIPENISEAICGRKECYWELEACMIGDPVTNALRLESEVVYFLINISYKSLMSSKANWIFKPFPIYFNRDIGLKSRTLSLETYEIPKQDLNKLQKTIKQNLVSPNDLIETLKKFVINTPAELFNDEMLCTTLNETVYYFIRFIVMSNSMKLRRTTLADSQLSGEIQQYTIVYDQLIEQQFKDTRSNPDEYCYLYHGSSIHNWHSIIRNGIKVMSGTKLQVNGAAYGKGVYLSDTFSMSAQSYSTGEIKEGRIIAVVEVNQEQSTIKRHGNILVVDDDKKLLIRYLVLIPKKCLTYQTINMLNKSFNTRYGKIKEIKQRLGKKENTRRDRRLLKDMKNYTELKNSVERDYKLSIIGDDLTIWKAELGNFPASPLSADMNKFNLKFITLEIRFPERYPSEPPYIRVVSPIFQFRTGHITQGGAICIELLTNTGWSPMCGLDSVMAQLRVLFIEGGARIERKGEYSYNESLEGFERLKRTHGWT